ncbi:jg11451 [Pararge aegeria aegeria]|uniref:Jg11451 protein n=1 Tax=Pararge aegeria aegeria TaxID=348720 RepID=A0A8S4S3W5_9NEOP|nr:jg11451 [Pararge aegeria aegeria]
MIIIIISTTGCPVLGIGVLCSLYPAALFDSFDVICPPRRESPNAAFAGAMYHSSTLEPNVHPFSKLCAIRKCYSEILRSAKNNILGLIFISA